MKKGKAKVIGIFWGLFLVTALVVSFLGRNDFIGHISSRTFICPRSDTRCEIEQMSMENLPKIKVTEENFREIQLYDEKKVCFVDVQRNCRSISVKFWVVVTGDCIFYTEEVQRIPFTQEVKNVAVRLEPEEIVLFLN